MPRQCLDQALQERFIPYNPTTGGQINGEVKVTQPKTANSVRTIGFFYSCRQAYRRDYSSETDFRKSVAKYTLLYNEQRPHQTLAYKSPVRFEELYEKEKTQAL